MNSRMEELLVSVIQEAKAMTEDHIAATHPSMDAAERLARAAVELQFEIIEWYLDRTEEGKK